MGACTMGSHRILLVGTVVLGLSGIGSAQSPTYGVGRAPTAEEVRAWDIAISPTGKELPPGRGSAKEGAQVYVQRGCAGCPSLVTCMYVLDQFQSASKSRFWSSCTAIIIPYDMPSERTSSLPTSWI